MGAKALANFSPGSGSHSPSTKIRAATACLGAPQVGHHLLGCPHRGKYKGEA